MAKPVDVGMEKGDLKRLLNAAKGDPVNCAIGLGGNAAGLIMMHKNKPSKGLEKELTAKFPDMKMSRWGTAKVDEDGVVKITINKAISGMARRLTKSLKGSGFSKVEILLEDGSSVDGASDEEEAGEEDGAEGEADGTAPPDLGQLQGELMKLVGQIAAAAGSDAGRAGAMKAKASEAASALKAQDAAAAQTAVGQFKAMLEAPPASADVAPVSFVTMQKSRLLWDSARKKVAGEIASLKKEAMDLFEGDPEESQVIDALDQLDEITGTLDDRLMDALDDVLNEQDPAKHAELLKDAKDILGDYADFVKSNALVQQLNGDTPFGTKLTIGPTYTTIIKALQANLR